MFLRCFGQEEAKIAAGRPSRSAKTFYIEVRHFPGGSSRPLTIFTMGTAFSGGFGARCGSGSQKIKMKLRSPS